MSPRSGTQPRLRLVRTYDSAFPEELYVRVSPVINDLLWTLLGPDPDRDDLAHEIFQKILRKARGRRVSSSLEAWAARITVSSVRSELFWRKLRRCFLLRFSEPSEPHTYHPDFRGRELLLRTYHVLWLLPIRERVPFTLQFVGGHSLADVAHSCRLSVTATERRVRAARIRFVRLASSDRVLVHRLISSQFNDGRDV